MRYAIQIGYNDIFETALKNAQNAGFEYVAIGFGSNNVFLNDDWKTDVEKIEALLRKYSLKCIQTHMPFYDLLLSAEITDEATDTSLLRSIEAGGMLGAEWNVYHPRSAINDNYSPRKSMEYAKAAVSSLAEKAAECKSGIAIENIPVFPDVSKMRFFTSDYEDLCELCDYFNSEYVSICWDFGHANLLGNDQEKAFAYIGNRIKCTHIHSNDGNMDQHNLPSQGSIEWEKIMPAFKKAGYNGALTLEIKYKDKPYLESYFRHALDCLKYIDELA